MPAVPAPWLSPQLFAILQHLIESRTGLHYALADADLLADKIAARAAEAGFDSLLDYYYFLRYDPRGEAEFDALIDALVVGETYFFREADQLATLCDALLGPRVARGERARVWCAACASGEEPLTLAMMLDARGLLGGVDLVASDISRRALERAREGAWGPRSLRALPPGVLGRWLVEQGDGRVTARPALRAAVRWERVNLVDRAAVRAMGRFDAVLCRNVLIYFSDETTRGVVDALAGALAPGGRLLVGASESLLRFGSLLECEERAGAFFYRLRGAEGGA